MELTVCKESVSVPHREITHIVIIFPPTGTLLFFQFSAIEGFERAKELAGELLDTYIISGVHLAWTMVTRIPPMFAIQPQKHEPPNTTLEDGSEDASQQTILVPLRPILFFSYEGHPAIEGILAAIPFESKWMNIAMNYK